jgi:hypothetical protein
MSREPLADFMRLIAMQSTTAQHAQQYDGNRMRKWIDYLAHNVTTNKRLPPATAVVTQPDANTIVMTVTLATPEQTPAATPTG